MAVSEHTSPPQQDQSGTSLNNSSGGSSPARPNPPVEDTSDASDYQPDQPSSSTDEDFEPSPPPTAAPVKTKKSAVTGRRAKNQATPSSKKENMKITSNMKTTPKPRAAARPSSGGGVKCAELPGNKTLPTLLTSPQAQVRARGGLKRSWVPPGPANRQNSECRTSVVSPHTRTSGSTAIRVGLSRRAPVKPLHQASKKS